MPELQHANHVGLTHALVGDELRLTVTVEPGQDGTDGVGVPAGGSTGQVLTKATATNYDTTWATPAASVIEAVAGGSGFASVGGDVILDMQNARNFLYTVNANVTSVSLLNVPAANTWVAPILLAVKFGSPSYLFSSFLSSETVQWRNGNSIADLNKTGIANLLSLVKIDGIVFVTLAWNGDSELDPYKMVFTANGTYPVPTDNESIDLANYSKPSGNGTITFNKNGGSAITARTSFAVGDVLNVVVTSLTTNTAVRIPRYTL
jgi:hypothetical protein